MIEIGDYITYRWRDADGTHVYASYPYLYSVSSFGVEEIGAINLWRSMNSATYLSLAVIKNIIYRRVPTPDRTFDPKGEIWIGKWTE